MSKITIRICDVCGQKIDSEDDFKTMTIVPHGSAPRESRRVYAKQWTVHVCEDCFERIGFHAEPSITLTGGKIGRVDK